MRVTNDPLEAALALAECHLAAVPTETVYGLGARADDAHAIAQIYVAKGRPANHPLIAHLPNIEALDAWGKDIPDFARALAEAFWPGPLTLVIKRTDRAGDFLTGAQDSVAVRVSAHPLMQTVQQELVRITGDASIAIAAPSANRFGQVSPTSADHVKQELGMFLSANDVILDGGDCEIGLESTIIDCTGTQPQLLRPGAITIEQVEQTTGMTCTHDSQVRASGTLDSHYSPRAEVRLVTQQELEAGDYTNSAARIGLLASADITTPIGLVRLAEPTSTDEYARILYWALREADALELRNVLAVSPESHGLGTAILDRLSRAAHPK
ncbi:MAG: L-threonylcarbamoyladenylate synthase [Actinomycetota bacterium]|nr:L-threonylcarbamoyladenylate synthase [Actinomycetota bacterium]